MFTYSQVETALAKTFAIRNEALGAFRGRIKHFQRLGLVPSSPGKGRKISYEREDIYKWAIGLEFAEFGVDPSLIKNFINFFAWHYVEQHLLNDAHAPDKLFVFYPNLLSGWAREENKPQHVAGLVCAIVKQPFRGRGISCEIARAKHSLRLALPPARHDQPRQTAPGYGTSPRLIRIRAGADFHVAFHVAWTCRHFLETPGIARNALRGNAT